LEDEDLPAALRLTPTQAAAAEIARRNAAMLKNEPGAEWYKERFGHISPSQKSVNVLTDHVSAIRRLLGEAKASNNWVVHGSRTESKKPILCNDPHLNLMAPSIWLLIHLKAPGLNVIGASFAGAPGVILGRNEKISWGVTNTGADVQDLFIMEEAPGNHTHYRWNGEWVPYDIRYQHSHPWLFHPFLARIHACAVGVFSDEIIKVKGGADVILPVRETLYGPVVTDIDLDWGNIENPPLSLRWTSLAANDTTFQVTFSLLCQTSVNASFT
jgi:acyl-homoserine lactone acylase PvdQ